MSKTRLIGSSAQLATVLSIALLPSLGCQKIGQLLSKSDESSTTDETAGGAEEQAALDRDIATSQKLDAHIDCLNRASRDAARAHDSYLRSIDEQKGPTGEENSVYIAQLNSQSCLQALEKAKAAEPELPEIDKVSVTYAAALKKLSPLVDEAHTYYDQKNFRDDDFAKGKSMHAGLMASFAEFKKAHDAFEGQVTSLNRQLQERRLARLKGEPDAKLEYLATKTMFEAKPLMNMADIAELNDLDQKTYKEALDKYAASVEELKKYVQAHPEEAGKVSMFSSFQSQTEELLKSGKELYRNARDSKELESHPAPEHTLGHPANVMREYNELVGSSNNLTYLR